MILGISDGSLRAMTIKSIGQGDHYISSDYLILLAEMAFERGIATSELFADTGLDEQLLLQPDVSVGHESALAFVERFCLLTQDLTVALEFGKRMTLSKHGVLGFATQYSETMFDAGEKMTRYLGTRAQIFSMERDSDDQFRRLVITSHFHSDIASPFLILAFLASIESICRTLINDEVKKSISEIHIELPEAQQSQVLARQLEQQTMLPYCHIIVSDKNSLIWPATTFFMPLPFFNPKMENVTEQRLQKLLSLVQEPNSLTEKVARILAKDLSQLPTVEQIAQQLHMSAATFNRKLKAESSSFQQIKDDVRFQRAKELLNETLSLDAIAVQLGYSDASNFTKAFKNWSGQSPTQFRK